MKYKANGFIIIKKLLPLFSDAHLKYNKKLSLYVPRYQKFNQRIQTDTSISIKIWSHKRTYGNFWSHKS